RVTIGWYTAITGRTLLHHLLFIQRRTMAERKRVEHDSYSEFPEFSFEQCTKYMGCKIYICGPGRYYGSDISIVDRDHRSIYFRGKDAGKSHTWIVAGICRCLYHF